MQVEETRTSHVPFCAPVPLSAQVIEELFTYWNLDDADETLEELEDALIVSRRTLAGSEPRAERFKQRADV